MFSQVPDFKAWFSDIEEFPRPDWKAIGRWISQNVSTEKLDEAWQAIAREWLQRLCERLGKSYSASESQNFHLLSELDGAGQKNLLTFLEQARSGILQRLGNIPLPKRHGKHVILRFTEDDEYYRYISYFDRDGEHASSGGQFLNRDYKHIAYPHMDMIDVDGGTLVHELSHNLLESFPLPLWLNEALAMAFESSRGLASRLSIATWRRNIAPTGIRRPSRNSGRVFPFRTWRVRGSPTAWPAFS